MLDLVGAIYRKLAASADVTAIVSTRISHGVSPDSVRALAHVTYFIVGGSAENTFNGDESGVGLGKVERTVIQVSMFTPQTRDHTSILSLFRAVDAAMDNGTLTFIENQMAECGCTRDSAPRIDFVDDCWQASADYRVTASRIR